jgi:small-conductance mechanosensitive channel
VNSGVGRWVPRTHQRPAGWLLPLLAVYFAIPVAGPAAEQLWLLRLVASLLIVAFGFLIVRLLRVMEDVLAVRFNMAVADNLRARRFHTQFRVLRQVLTVVIWVLAGSAILLQFEGLRQFGGAILASAGIAGIVIGFAAQRTLGNLIAGFQIALTQPIRLDDVVIVEGEWGKIEEITLTYVVVAIWDQRRLIVPIAWFIDHPFENWTRTRADILGTVFLHVDYTVPLEPLREKVKELVTGHPDWDGRVAELIMLESHATTLELRALISAVDSGAAWRLRVHVREGLVTYLQQNHPDALPRFRIDGGPKDS